MITRLSNEGEPLVKFTVEGGLAIRLTNETGSNSVKGQLVIADTTADSAFKTSGASDDAPIGVVYESGIADGSKCWVVIGGIAEVLLKDSTGATRGYWVKTSDTAGRADATASAPPGFVAGHMQEVGHCLETKSGGTNVLAKCLIHFN